MHGVILLKDIWVQDSELSTSPSHSSEVVNSWKTKFIWISLTLSVIHSVSMPAAIYRGIVDALLSCEGIDLLPEWSHRWQVVNTVFYAQTREAL